jgi:predicted AAA+ superfamily ATPase
VDEHPRRGRFILTGSANFQLMASISQSLAGRTALLQLLPLSLEEIRRFPRPPRDLYDVLFRGGYPALHRQKLDPVAWHNSYVGTYVERDVRAEVLKGHTHRGLPPRLTYFRDRKGEEVDLIVERAEGITAIEVKSGETVTSESLRPLDRLEEAVRAATPPSSGRVDRTMVYGGRERQERSTARIVPWSDLDREDWTGPPRRSRHPRRAPGAP